MLDVAIIGGGPAGLTAGLYTTRGGLKNVIMFEKGMPGGQITQSSEIENYPGVSEVKSGIDLMENWPEQCKRFGLKHEMDEVVRVSQNSDKTFKIETASKKEYMALSVIVCTGGRPKKGGFKGENEFFGKGVSTCATCDGFFYRNKDVVVLGGGDTALEEALYLANICNKVYLVHRREKFRASPSTVERVMQNKKIELVLGYVIDEVKGDASGVNMVVVEPRDGGEKREIEVPGIFTFVGYDVNNQVLIQEDGTSLCALNDFGEVVVDLSMNTSIEGLFAAGDLRINAPKQVVCAAGDGATAAIEAISYCEKVKEH